MHLKIVVFLLLVLCQLGKRFLSQLTTAGYMYELVAGQDSNDDVSASAKFTAYFDCWQDDSCLYVAKEKSSGKFLLKKTGEVVNNDDYSAVWKKNTVGMLYISKLGHFMQTRKAIAFVFGVLLLI